MHAGEQPGMAPPERGSATWAEELAGSGERSHGDVPCLGRPSIGKGASRGARCGAGPGRGCRRRRR